MQCPCRDSLGRETLQNEEYSAWEEYPWGLDRAKCPYWVEKNVTITPNSVARTLSLKTEGPWEPLKWVPWGQSA
jgi:hypothetical protein